ncbi:MAG: TIR domain-containing protein [Clostridia bacterium]|nr:TIR domain-containing protein [Clostridia bacterium]
MGKYKVFISFKNTDNGAETKDAVMANELYRVLTENNIPTFFSKVSILESGEGDYRNLIDAALDECSILIAVGTRKEYLESKWVKYEYASFHEDILSGNKDVNKCTVCSYIAGMRQRDLPRPLRNLQSFENMDLLVDFVKNHIRKLDETEQSKTEEAVVAPADDTTVKAVEIADDATVKNAEEPEVVKPAEEKVPEKEVKKDEIQKKEVSAPVVAEKPVIEKKSKKKIIIGIAAAVVALIVIISIIISIAKKVDVPVVVDGEAVELEYSVDDIYVNMYSAELNEESMTALAEIECMESIYLKDCTFTDDSYKMFGNMSELRSLNFENVQGVSDFSFVADMELHEIKLINCGLTDENHNLGERVNDVCETLDLSGNAEFSNLHCLEKFTALENLKIDSTGVRVLYGLENLSSLKVFSFNNCRVGELFQIAGIDLHAVYGDNTDIHDISRLAGLENLENISFENTHISRVTDEFRSLRLKHVNLNNNPIVSLIGFKNLTVLEDLYFGYFEPLPEDRYLPAEESGFDVLISRNAKTLKNLDVSYTSVTKKDLDTLVNAENLQTVDISGIQTSDLSFLANSLQLESVRAENCGLTNIDALASAVGLKEAYLASNSIKDISSLKMDESVYVYLDLSDNGIVIDGDSFMNSDEMKFQELLLYGNKITNLSFLQNLAVVTLGITYDESHDPSLIKGGLYIDNIPEHKIVAYEDAVVGEVITGRYDPAAEEDLQAEQ